VKNVKRVISACVEQTLKFDGEEEFQTYFHRFDRRGTKYKIVGKEAKPGLGIIVKIIKEYTTYPLGDYID
jgi:hypothetical protein